MAVGDGAWHGWDVVVRRRFERQRLGVVAVGVVVGCLGVSAVVRGRRQPRHGGGELVL